MPPGRLHSWWESNPRTPAFAGCLIHLGYRSHQLRTGRPGSRPQAPVLGWRCHFGFLGLSSEQAAEARLGRSSFQVYDCHSHPKDAADFPQDLALPTGLEPASFRSTGGCPTNWASEACVVVVARAHPTTAPAPDLLFHPGSIVPALPEPCRSPEELPRRVCCLGHRCAGGGRSPSPRTSLGATPAQRWHLTVPQARSGDRIRTGDLWVMSPARSQLRYSAPAWPSPVRSPGRRPWMMLLEGVGGSNCLAVSRRSRCHRPSHRAGPSACRSSRSPPVRCGLCAVFDTTRSGSACQHPIRSRRGRCRSPAE